MGTRMLHAAAVAGDKGFLEAPLLSVHRFTDGGIQPIVVGNQPLPIGFVGIEMGSASPPRLAGHQESHAGPLHAQSRQN